MALTLYGIPNCDTVKKARTWLAQKGHDAAFHDFRKDGLTRAKVEHWLTQVPADRLLNRRGTTWRKLDAAQQARAESDLAGLLVDHPSLIKRPVIETGGAVLVGFTEAERAALEG
jgi:arsenate reductase